MNKSRFPNSFRFLEGRARHAMSPQECDLLEGLIETTEAVSNGHVVLQRGECVDRSTLLIEGFIARTIVKQERNHIIALHVPGDFVDLHAFPLKRLDHNVVAIGSAKVGYVSHASLNKVLATQPHLARLLWFSTLLDAAIHREWIVTLEHLDADGRLAHLLCEISQRLAFVGLTEATGYNLPLTQAELASACGTTAIHLNRIIRRLREARIVELIRGRVTILDAARLAELGQFSPEYLYGAGDLKLKSEF